MRYILTFSLIVLYTAARAAEPDPIKAFKIVCNGDSVPNIDRVDNVYQYSNDVFEYFMVNAEDRGKTTVYEFKDPLVHYSEQHDKHGDFIMIHAKQKTLQEKIHQTWLLLNSKQNLNLMMVPTRGQPYMSPKTEQNWTSMDTLTG